MPPRPLLLLTCFRRYHELAAALANIRRAVADGEFAREPLVWVVWACPEPGRRWFFRELLEQGSIHRVLGRPALPGESVSHSTTYPESHNIRLGLNEALAMSRQDPFEDYYVVVQAADVLPQHGTYRWLEERLGEGHRAVVFHWENGCRHSGVWHTNFFLVPLDPRYWPPLSPPDHVDTLERQFAVALEQSRAPDVHPWHNYGGRRFAHAHRSEELPPWPVRPERHEQGLGLAVKGYLSPWRRLCRFLGGVWNRLIRKKKKESPWPR